MRNSWRAGQPNTAGVSPRGVSRHTRPDRRLRMTALLLLMLGLAASDENLPPDADGAKAAIERSPRHGEWADVKVEGTSVRTWVVYPERKDKAPVVIVIHEVF